jgi:hypothetical protein
MEGISKNRQFGVLIAYLLPGFIALAGMAPLFPVVSRWLHPVEPGFGPPLYALLAATAIGQILSCFRWLFIDQFHRLMGVQRPEWDDSLLDDRLNGFDYLVQSHFRYYEFCGNTLLAVLFAYGLNRFLGTLPFLGVGTDLGMLVLATVLFAASRDALAKYYTRTGRLVGLVAEKASRGDEMYNGNDHGGHSDSTSKPKPETKPQQAPNAPAKPQPAGGKEKQTKN